jgi:hypothetical protein
MPARAKSNRPPAPAGASGHLQRDFTGQAWFFLNNFLLANL